MITGPTSDGEPARRPRCRHALAAMAAVVAVLMMTMTLDAHGVTNRDAEFVRTVKGAAIGPFIYLGGKHMVTGYDHLLFLVGVVFFLYRARDVVAYVSLFTVGHSVTLLAGVLANVHANAYLIDAVIGLSVVYKGFENIGGFERLFGFTLNSRFAVLTFGLFHGFGLATKLQDLRLPANGLVTNLISFNVGVEFGQALALGAVLIALSYWRTSDAFRKHAFVTNTALMTGGFMLMGYQLVAYGVTR